MASARRFDVAELLDSRGEMTVMEIEDVIGVTLGKELKNWSQQGWLRCRTETKEEYQDRGNELGGRPRRFFFMGLKAESFLDEYGDFIVDNPYYREID